MLHAWLVSRNRDLAFLILPALLGYAFLAAVAMGAPVRPFWLVMLLALDGPHAFATAHRTYLHVKERGRLGWRLWLIVPLLAVPVTAMGAGFVTPFLFVALTWLHWHIAKQHIGIIALWKRKAGEAFWPHEGGALKALLLLPLAGYWLMRAGVLDVWPWLLLAGVGIVAVIIANEVARGVCAPKFYLLALAVPLQWLAFYMAGSSPEGIVLAGIAISAGHAVQYQFLTWTYLDSENRDASPWPMRIAKYTAIVLGLNLLLNVAPRTVGLSAMTFGWAFMHFWLDGSIWRTKEYPVLKAALKLP